MQEVSRRLWNDLHEAVQSMGGESFTRSQIAKRMGRAKTPVLAKALDGYVAEGWLLETRSPIYRIPMVVYRETEDFPRQLALFDMPGNTGYEV